MKAAVLALCLLTWAPAVHAADVCDKNPAWVERTRAKVRKVAQRVDKEARKAHQKRVGKKRPH